MSVKSTTIAIPAWAEERTPFLTVRGNRLVEQKSGTERWLQGVSVSSLECWAEGQHIPETVEQAISVWSVNVIRLAVHSKFWLAEDAAAADVYRRRVDDVVATCQARGVYLVLDLHEYRAVSTQHVRFWQDAAVRYMNHPCVIFGLLNEAHTISWEVWRNGGDVTDNPKQKDGVFAENSEPIVAFRSVGFQPLVEAIRATGAMNLISAGGLDWAYDLSGILEGYALVDTAADGLGIMYETHVYPWKSGWLESFVNAAAKYPLLVGEVGCQPECMPFIPIERHEAPETWAPDMIGCIQELRLNWTAWCFHPRHSPCLLSDWNFTPTPYWGEPVLRAFRGEKFTMRKMR